jgi:hypothetical protein
MGRGYTEFRFAEIKAVTDDEFRNFNIQTARWKLSRPVSMIICDYNGDTASFQQGIGCDVNGHIPE